MSNAKSVHLPRTVLFGMPGALLTSVLTVLRLLEVPLEAVVTPAPRGTTRSILKQQWPSLDGMTTLHSPANPPIAHYMIRSTSFLALQEHLDAIRPDLILIACFPWLLPRNLFQQAQWLAVNIHPSLLPAHRGPDPLFWTFHDGEAFTGVSIHHLNEQFDSGPILLQQKIDVAAGTTYKELERETSAAGCELLYRLISTFPDKPPVVFPSASPPSRQGALTAEDLVIQPNWSVDHARRFIAGVAASHGPLQYRETGGRFTGIAGLGDGPNPAEIVLSNGTLNVQIAPTRNVRSVASH
jgi:methionyl-tRNA formyltransferase